MPKLAWVLLPLAAIAAWLALCAWRGRLPTRPTLNVLFSLLLLGYVSGTAGLGIFWVANQQLPVFDWHYTFGYATVLVLVVHLGFNLRIVWQHLRRLVRRDATAALPRASAAPGAEAGAAGRRPLLGMAGAAALTAAAGLGYLVGLRHGRTELQVAARVGARVAAHEAANEVDPGRAAAEARGGTSHPAAHRATAASAASAAEAWAAVEQFHAFSAHSRTRVLRHAASTDWGGAPAPFKHYPGAERLRLPSPAAAGRVADATTPDLAALATWLWHTAGISERRGGIAFRTSPSSGALFATELYVLALDGKRGLAPGAWWHYDAEAHALQRVPAGPIAARGPATTPGPGTVATPAALGPLALPAPCDALVVATSVFARSGHKYGDRTYRYVLADLGHALENLRCAAAAHGQVHALPLSRFDESALATALALDERREGVLAAVALAPPGAVLHGTERDSASTGPANDVRWASAWPAGTTGTAPARLGLTDAMHTATSLRALPARHEGRAATPLLPGTRPPGAAAPAEGTATASPAPPHFSGHTLPPAHLLTADPLQVIARRRSLRRFSAEPMSQQALADVLHALTGPAPQLSLAVRIDVLTTAVVGLPPAAWRVEAAPHRGGRAGAVAPMRLRHRVAHGAALRRRARAAALEQDVIGDAAVVFVLSLDRGALQADPEGAARGYRHGFIEAGLVGERIYLAAGALGLGACAVGAFYDDEAAALVGLDAEREWPVHFAALGVLG